MTRLIWSIVIIAVAVALPSSFLELTGSRFGISGLGVLFVLPLGVVGYAAVCGLRNEWSRGIAVVGLMSSAIATALAAFLAAISGVAADWSPKDDHPESLLAFTAIAALVAGVGCLVASIVGPPRDLLEAEPEAEPR